MVMAQIPTERFRLDMQTTNLPYSRTGQAPGSSGCLGLWPMVVAGGSQSRVGAGIWSRIGRLSLTTDAGSVSGGILPGQNQGVLTEGRGHQFPVGRHRTFQTTFPVSLPSQGGCMSPLCLGICSIIE